jgi:hypothetical protein
VQPFDYPLKFAVLAGTSKLHAHVALYVALCQINILQSGIRAIQGRRTTRNIVTAPSSRWGLIYSLRHPSPACDPIQHVSCTLDLAESPLLSFHIYFVLRHWHIPPCAQSSCLSQSLRFPRRPRRSNVIQSGKKPSRSKVAESSSALFLINVPCPS